MRVAALALVLFLASPGLAQQPPPGATSCSGCHAPAARATGMPTLEGRAPADIVTAMQEFRAGRRHATVMDRIAKGFADDELAALAAYVVEPRR
jgi:cytochrome c553